MIGTKVQSNEQENTPEKDKQLFKKLADTMMVLRKDPRLYVDEIKNYIDMFKQQFNKLTESTQKKNQRFGELAIFLCRCCIFYSADMRFISEYLMDLLNNYANILHPYNRRKAVAGIMILRSKNLLFPVATIQFLLKMMGVLDKEMRKMIYSFVVNDIKRMNKHHKNNSINKQLQTFIFEYIKKNSDKVARKMVNLMIELYKRNIWNDHKVVNIIAHGCLNNSYKIRLISAYFLISTTEPKQLEDSDEQDIDPTQIKAKKGITKVTKFKEKQVEKQKKRAQRKLKKRQESLKVHNFFPIDQIYNPQDFSEKLFSVMSKKQQKFIVKTVLMSLLARMIGRHKLIILPFYSYLQKYMHPAQKQIAKILSFFAESIHSLIPEEELEPIIKYIIQNFVNDRCSEQAMTMGLNVIRQVANKNNLIITSDMMMYLCTYYEYKNKNVAGAAKSLINVVRTINPELLEKKYRGRRPGEVAQNVAAEDKLQVDIDGAYLLDQNATVPVYMDRILTDEDFRRIRILKKKKQKQQEAAQEEQQDQQQEEQQSIKQQQIVVSSSEDEQNQIQQDDAEDWITEKGEDEEQAEEEQSELDWGEVEQQVEEQQQQQDKTTKLKNKNRKRRTDLSELESELQLSEELSEENPHGFVHIDRIAFYKKSKGEVKAQKRQQKQEQGKKKFVHTPKEKGGGTNDKEKLKNKPLMMIRPKKNKLRLREKQVKTKIKDLKNKLGKVRSGKQAKKLKNKKVKR